MNNSLPSFFKDDSNSDKYEELIDFFISWTLRCSEEKYKDANILVQRYSKRVLSFLCFNEANYLDKNNFKVSRVKVWRQYQKADLWAEIEIENFSKKIALIFENKMHSATTKNQLEEHKRNAHNHYRQKSEIVDLVFILLWPDYTINNKTNEKNEIEQTDFKYHILEELSELCFEEGKMTGNDLFDEFWFKW